MRFKAFAIAICFCQAVHGDSLIQYKEICAEIGFGVGTEGFGNCVLQLFDRNTDGLTQPKDISEPDDHDRFISDLVNRQQWLIEKRLRDDQLRQAERQVDLEKINESLRILQGIDRAMPNPIIKSHSTGSQNRLEKQEVRGDFRICYYRISGSLKPLTLNSNEFCPPSL